MENLDRLVAGITESTISFFPFTGNRLLSMFWYLKLQFSLGLEPSQDAAEPCPLFLHWLREDSKGRNMTVWNRDCG